MIAAGHNKRFVRTWFYVFHSRIDFCDLWLSVLFVALGTQMGAVNPVDTTWYYQPASSLGLTSEILSFLFTTIGAVNIVKIFYPSKPNLTFDLILKVAMFFLLVLMALSTMRYSAFHIVSIFYSMLSVLSASLIVRTM